MEHASAMLGYHIGMTWGDARAPFIQKLQAHNGLGFMNQLFGSLPVDLMTRFINADTELERKLTTHPVFVSALDMT